MLFSTFYIRLLQISVGRYVLSNSRKALKLLDFLSVQKRIYAKLTPLTPKIQVHDRVTEIGTCQKQVPIFCLPGKYPILKNPMSVRQLGAIGRTAGEHFQTVTDGGQHRL